MKASDFGNRLGTAAASIAALTFLAGCAGTGAVKPSAEPAVEYLKLDGGKLVPGKVKVNAFFEVRAGERIYVFISPKAKDEFEKTGKIGGKPVSGFGFGPDGETVVFESEWAQKEWETRKAQN